MALATLKEMKAAHHVLAEMAYDLRPVERGYANRTLYAVSYTHLRAHET